MTTASEAITANTAPTAALTKQGTPNTKTGKVAGKITASDPDGDKITYVTPITTALGTVTINAKGAFTYTPTAAARHAAAASNAPLTTRTDTFNIVVTDGHGGVASVPVTVPIAPANTAPAAKSTVISTNPVSGVVTGHITVTDKDSDTPAFTVSASPTRGVVSIRPDGSFSYTPTAEARTSARNTTKTDTDKFTVTVDDGHGGQKALPVTVNIAPSDTAPVNVVSTVGSPNANTGAIKGVVTATDNEGDALTFTGSTTTARGKVTVARDGTFTYTPTAQARHDAIADHASSTAKIDTFTVNVVDKYGASTPVSITVNILAKNAAPGGVKTKVAQSDNVTGTVTGSIAVADTDKDILTYSGSTTTSQGSVIVNANGTFSFTPTTNARAKAAAPNATAADKQFNFTVTTNDGHGGVTPINVTVAISPNTAPVNANATVGQPNSVTGVVSGTISATDPDGDKLTYSGPASTGKGNVSINATTGAFTYTPTVAARHAASLTTGAASDDSFSVTITDGKGATLVKTVTVSILPSNVAPVAQTPIVGAPDSSGVVRGSFSATDADNDVLTYSGPSSTSKGSISVTAGGSFTYIPTEAARRQAAVGSAADKQDSFTVAVSDAHGGSASITVTVSVLGLTTTNPVVTTYRQVTTPNFSVSAQRGWCLKFVDDTVNAPSRSATAQLSFNRENANGNITAGDPPVGVWAPIFFSIGSGANAGQGHVAWAFNHGGGYIEVRDSETQPGARPVYTSIGQVLSWFSKSDIKYLGWSTWVDGRQIVEKVTSSTGGGGTSATSGTKSGTATVIVQVNVRNDPSTNGPVVAQYSPGQTFNYDSWVIGNGFYWLSYVSYSGTRRYVAEATADGRTVYVRGGVFH